MSSPRPVAPRSDTPATSVVKRTQRVQWMHRVDDGFHQRADVLVFDGALVLFKAVLVDAIGHGLILQVALATLVADRAIQRVVDEQKLHHPFAGFFTFGERVETSGS